VKHGRDQTTGSAVAPAHLTNVEVGVPDIWRRMLVTIGRHIGIVPKFQVYPDFMNI